MATLMARGRDLDFRPLDEVKRRVLIEFIDRVPSYTMLGANLTVP
jgi:hypothetical protein